ncbi:MAG: hypothetical protein J6333_03855, partial [Planctomycetes bacterium]|nr:hypothetical protein [Planctomycetota bacterium]
ASLDAAAPFVMASGTADRGLDLSWREGAGAAAGAIAESARVGASNYSGGWAYRWLRLTRKGNLFTAHWSADGQAWLLLGSRTVALPTEIYVGMAGASAASGAANELLFDNVVLGK